MLMGFEEESAGLSEAQLATPGTVLVPPSETVVEQLATRMDTPAFRSWCCHCVRAKGKDGPHHGSSPGGVSQFATNFIVMGEDGIPIIFPAGYDELTKTCCANMVLCKDMSHRYTERTLATNVLSWVLLCIAHGGTTSSYAVLTQRQVSLRGFLFGWRCECFGAHVVALGQ